MNPIFNEPETPMNYCVLTADIHQSRLQADRQSLQSQIENLLAAANAEFQSEIQVPFSVTLGDEWQGVVKNLAAGYKLATFFLEEFHPTRLAIGLGEGRIETEWRSRSAEMDGEAFHRSRQALDEAKKKGRALYFSSSHPREDLLFNALARLLQIMREDWSEKQFRKFKVYKKFRNETKTAREIGVSQSDIHQTLLAIHAADYLQAESDLLSYFEQLSQRT